MPFHQPEKEKADPGSGVGIGLCAVYKPFELDFREFNVRETWASGIARAGESSEQDAPGYERGCDMIGS